jgi:hypothetical protein
MFETDQTRRIPPKLATKQISVDLGRLDEIKPGQAKQNNKQRKPNQARPEGAEDVQAKQN